MLFFGICLNDAGYGLILLAMGMAMLWKFQGGHDAPAPHGFAHDVRRLDDRIRPLLRIVHRRLAQSVLPVDPLLRLPGEVFLAGRWPSAWCRFCSDKYCVSSCKCYGGIPLCAFDAGLVPRHPRGQSGRRASAARSGVGHSGIHHSSPASTAWRPSAWC